MFWENLDVERWIVAVHDQVAALEEGMRSTVRHTLSGDGPASAAESQEGEHAAVHQTIRLLRLDAMTLYLTDALNQLGRALRAKGPVPAEFGDLFERARVLRNVYEHWDETRANFERPDVEAVKSVKAYKLAHPGEKPWTLGRTEDGFVVGAVLRLDEVKAMLAILHDELKLPDALLHDDAWP